MALTTGIVLDEEESGKETVWLKALVIIVGTGGVLAIIAGLVRIVIAMGELILAVAGNRSYVHLP